MKKLLPLLLPVCLCRAEIEVDNVDDLLTLADPNLTEGLASLSVAVWVKMSSGDATSTDTIVAQWGGGDDSFTMQWASTENIIFRVRDSAQTEFSATFTDGILDTNWHLLIGVVDENADLVSVYVDGVVGGSTAAFTDVTGTSTLNLSVAAESAGTFPMGGRVGDVKIYNRAISAAEALLMYQARLHNHPLQNGLIAHWEFNDRADGAAADGLTFKDKVAGRLLTASDGANNTGMTSHGDTNLGYAE